ncbi:NmrA family transcriptional regulator [Pseudoroseicyclus aestuarii]|uniref:NAD(P)H dehydrogenase (Quinone) n=1 Tax=Pseudoroseicyclus aestuarii TaxID=1795041 RepID=A0A318SLS6_9RHOB|nr:NmrA family transcriptional regulator [Pseudoroseicyclus aestuarii]PYE80599.1 NAD(P)H dehydrogenase (quinone) [Pseudoroseicyclus aestuarii]
MILVTGASGQLASTLVTAAGAAGLAVSTASRSPDADRQMDFDRPDTLDFTGVTTLFLTSAGYAEDDVVIRRHGAAVTAARDQGVGHVVYSSLSRASDHLGFALAHRWTERVIEGSGMAWNILRNGLYAELIGSLAAPRDGRIGAPFGHGRISAVARADLADAALAVLRSPAAHVGRYYELSGASAFSVSDIARSLDVPYEPVSFNSERDRLSRLPLLAFQAPMLMSIYGAAAAGFLEADRTDLEGLVPRPRDAFAIACAVAQGKVQAV